MQIYPHRVYCFSRTDHLQRRTAGAGKCPPPFSQERSFLCYPIIRSAPPRPQEEAACCCRHRERTPEETKKLSNRLSRIEGQVRGIRGMIERDAYCPDILIQVAAASSALNSLTRELLDQHIRVCVAEDLRQGKEDKVDELLDVLQRLMR